jgi:para-aminobenzoate synthetase
VEARPIKGTTARGSTLETDVIQRDRLAHDPKFNAENLMIADLLRNDLAMICAPGTVTVPMLMEVESYASVHQLVTAVAGQLRPEIATVEALRAIFPAGSMTGAPKLRTMEVIEEVEIGPRGPYAGAFGWISGDGRADLGVVIRSLFRAGDGPWRLGTGGGITVRSELQEEWAETLWKGARLRTALQAYLYVSGQGW